MSKELEKLTLLVWLTKHNCSRKLEEVLSDYSGCDKEVYTEKVLIDIEERALIDISRKYHIKGLFYEYFNAKKRWEDYAFLFPKKYTYSELDALDSALFSITYKDVFDDEDKKVIEELKLEYFKNEKEA